MKKNPERLAWIILLISFFTCIGLSALIPLIARWYILNAQTGQSVTLEVQQQRGSLRVTEAGHGDALAIAEDRGEIPDQTAVVTDFTPGRFVIRTPGENDSLVAIIQLYDNTKVVLLSARSPRFAASHLPHQVTVEIKAGRVRIDAFSNDNRSTQVETRTPHGIIVLSEGSYEINVNTKTAVTVRQGQADILKDGTTTTLESREQAIISAVVVGPLPAARNLVPDSTFTAPLEEDWHTYNKDIERAGQPEGVVEKVETEERPAAIIERKGEGHAETGITQQINADIRPFSSLQLRLILRIEEHNVPLCGSAGSECPVMVRIDYQDAEGIDQEWLQGFYTTPDISATGDPTFCRSCPANSRQPHVQVREGIWYPYLSPNLIPLLSSQDGRAPTTITAVTIYASGHTYKSMVAEVELIAQE